MSVSCQIWLPPATLMRRILAVKPITLEELQDADQYATYKLEEDIHAQ